jgi:hypothetical protein
MAEEMPSREAVQRGHEIKDVSGRAIAWSAVAVVLIMAFSALIAYAWIDLSSSHNQAIAISERPPAAIPGPQPPPSSGLPGTPIEDPEVLAARKEARLHGYRWIDKEAGVVSVPIERAMELIVDMGLPEFGRSPREREPRR